MVAKDDDDDVVRGDGVVAGARSGVHWSAARGA